MSVDAHRSTSSTASALSAVSVALSGEVTNRLSNPLGPVHHGKMARLTAGNGKNRRAGMASDAGLRGEMRTPGQITAVGAGLAFPHAAQAIQIVRRRWPLTGKNTKKWSTETAYAITSLTAMQARAAELARIVRGHWGIEDRLHWVRDVVYDEDRSQVRTGNGPRVMASLRTLAITILRLTGHASFAAALRYHARQPGRPLQTIMNC